MSPSLHVARSDVVLEKHYKGITQRSTVELFWEQVLKAGKRDGEGDAARPRRVVRGARTRPRSWSRWSLWRASAIAGAVADALRDDARPRVPPHARCVTRSPPHSARPPRRRGADPVLREVPHGEHPARRDVRDGDGAGRGERPPREAAAPAAALVVWWASTAPASLRAVALCARCGVAAAPVSRPPSLLHSTARTLRPAPLATPPHRRCPRCWCWSSSTACTPSSSTTSAR